MILQYWRWIALAVLLAAAYGSGYLKAYNEGQIELTAEKVLHGQFVGGVEAVGKAAEKLKQETDLANAKRQEDADIENAAAVAALDRTIAGLRDERAKRDTRGGFVSQAAPGAVSLKLACYDAAKLDDALRKLDRGVQGLVAEGDKAVTDLNSARAWAQGR